MKVNTDEQLREEAWTEITGYSNCNKIPSSMCNKKVDKFLQLSGKPTQTDISLLCNSDGANAEDIAFLKEKKISYWLPTRGLI